jgi:nucleoside phosphorylase
MTDHSEFADSDAGHRYFRSPDREACPVFLSNAGPANALVRDIAQVLIQKNVPFFHYLFQNTIGLGQPWADQLDQMIAAGKVFMPLIDGSYWASEYCQQEYETAVRLARSGRITIVPLLLDGHENGPDIPYQGADLRGMPRPEQVELVVSRLVDLLAADIQPTPNWEAGGPVEAGRISVDVAIITILEEEYEAVLRLLKRVRRVKGSATLSNQHAWVVGEIDSPEVALPYSVALAMSPRPGTNAAVIVTMNTIQAFDPRCILAVGVAGGLGDLALGDVVVANRICSYGYGKTDRGFHPRHDMDSPTDAALTSAARTLTTLRPDWYSNLAKELDQPDEFRRLAPQIVVGQVASGDKIVDDAAAAFSASIRQRRPKLQAVEMEGGGAAAAIQDICEMQRVSFAMIRGISDLLQAGRSRPGRPGRSEQTVMRDSAKAMAATTAAAAAVQLIRLAWPRPPRAESQAGPPTP